ARRPAPRDRPHAGHLVRGRAEQRRRPARGRAVLGRRAELGRADRLGRERAPGHRQPCGDPQLRRPFLGRAQSVAAVRREERQRLAHHVHHPEPRHRSGEREDRRRHGHRRHDRVHHDRPRHPARPLGVRGSALRAAPPSRQRRGDDHRRSAHRRRRERPQRRRGHAVPARVLVQRRRRDRPAGWTTPIVLQSAGAPIATLRWYRFSDGGLVKSQSLPLVTGDSVKIDPRTVDGLADGTQYSVVVEATGGTIAGVVFEYADGGDNAMAYEAFPALTTDDPKAYDPKQYFKSLNGYTYVTLDADAIRAYRDDFNDLWGKQLGDLDARGV